MAMQIFLIEDDPIDTDWVCRILAKLNLAQHVQCAPTGELALETLREQADRGIAPPTLIMLDLGLPGMDGLHVLEQLKTDPWTAPIPVFILTGSSEDKLLLESYRLGASSYVVKPLTLEKLTAAFGDAGMAWTIARRETPAAMQNS